MPKILAIYGSPRRQGNTSLLLNAAVRGASDVGASVHEIVLRDLKMSPCLEIYGCKQTGRCVIQDDFQMVYDHLVQCRGLMLASPIFFYAVSAHTKMLMDRCQSFWVKKHWMQRPLDATATTRRKGLFISAGATTGKRLFEGALLSVRYFLEPLDMDLWGTLMYRSLDHEGDVSNHPDYLHEAYTNGRNLALALADGPSIPLAPCPTE